MVKETWKKNAKRVVALCMALIMCSGCATKPEEKKGEEQSAGRSEILIDGKYSVDPTKDPKDKAAYSGEAGELYYLSNDILKLSFGDVRNQYDIMTFVSSLQGVVNREKPTLFFDYLKNTDSFWYKYMRREGKLLYGYSQNVVKSLDDLIEIFKEQIKQNGLVVWDPSVPATSNVAATICSATDAIPVRKDSAFTQKLIEMTGAEIKVDLTGKFTGQGTIPDTNIKSTGSAKNDAYLWALEKYGDQLNWSVLGYYIDAYEQPVENEPYGNFSYLCIPNHDYIIANRGFFFDLSVWSDEAASDDPGQTSGEDYRTLCKILDYAYQKNGGEFFSVCGYTPWPRKYTNVSAAKGQHGDVETEWKFVEICSSYNGVVDADSAPLGELSNASLYQHYELKESYENNHAEVTEEYDSSKKYVMLYIGDYDSSAWTTKNIPNLWMDEESGTTEMVWSFNLNMSDRIPMAFDYIFEYKTENDYFAGADSGVGYVMANAVVHRTDSEYPSGAEQYAAYCKPYLKKFDVNYLGFSINSQPLTQEVFDMYKSMGITGFSHNNQASGTQVHDGIFGVLSSDLPEKHMDENDPKTNGSYILNGIKFNTGYNLYTFRSILWSPSQIKALKEYVTSKNEKVVFCNPETFAAMAEAAGK